jgi:ankyrin repeat protein
MYGIFTNVGDNFFTASANCLVSRQFLRDAIPYSKNINQRNSNGDTLLMVFARPQYLDAQFDKASCKALIAAGVDLNAQNDVGETVCTLASKPEQRLWFIEQGADPTLRRHDGKDVMDLITPILESFSKIKANKTNLATENPAASTERLQTESDYIKLRDTILEFKKKRATEAGSSVEVENRNEN